MFTGLIEELGTIQRITRSAGGRNITVSCSGGFRSGVAVGDSVAVNGCCLTAVRVGDGELIFNAVEETVKLSTLAGFRPGDRINLERALAAGSRFGGHFVQGHIDGIARFAGFKLMGIERRLRFELTRQSAEECIKKGGIAIDGISLTIAAIEGNFIEVAVIPHTWEHTNLHLLKKEATVNIETDIIGKWVRKLLREIIEADGSSGKLDKDFLQKYGFA